MDLQNFEKEFIKKNLNINESYGDIFCFIDFANVNNWFEKDNQWDRKAISSNQKININLEKLKNFVDLFSKKTFIYYGEDSGNSNSLDFTYAIRKIFGKKVVRTKDLQKIKHYFEVGESISGEHIQIDKKRSPYLEIRKCNFDVEISVDAVKMMKHYDTFCIFSGDADFVYLNKFLRKENKEVIIFKGGYITKELKESADLIINAQEIKEKITKLKTKT